MISLKSFKPLDELAAERDDCATSGSSSIAGSTNSADVSLSKYHQHEEQHNHHHHQHHEQLHHGQHAASDCQAAPDVVGFVAEAAPSHLGPPHLSSSSVNDSYYHQKSGSIIGGAHMHNHLQPESPSNQSSPSSLKKRRESRNNNNNHELNQYQNQLNQLNQMMGDHFEIVWSNLSYKIEPKWYKKINFFDRALAHFMPGQTIDSHSSATSTASSSAGMNDNQHQMHHSSSQSNHADAHLHGSLGAKPKSALDPIEIFTNLNGTIKSGQMTAVLGPSGAGKTTLLNCLTGKLKNGVSGYINLKGANGKNLKMCTIPQKGKSFFFLLEPNTSDNLFNSG